ncbi:MAG: zinc-dependent metalloprotease, partial [Phycisphaerales bacterium]|nr:zinc-dependent metalloprotease [Phycisphaerales bacterium]
KAFEKVGILDAIEVYQQDAQTGAYMDLDPEDARYNFILWTNANMGFAIGPSRVHPETGEILDADVVMDEGFISSWVQTYEKMMPEIALQNADPQTLAWFASRPQWDPRVRLARPAQRQQVLQQLAIDRAAQYGVPFAGHDVSRVDSTLIGDNRFDGLAGHLSQVNGACECARHAGLELAMLRMSDELLYELSIPRVDDAAAMLIDPISGTWEGEAEVPGQSVPFVMELQLLDGGVVTGTINAMMFMGEVSGTFDSATNALTMRMVIPDGPVVEFDLTIENDTMTGTATADGEAVPVAGRRTATAPTVDDDPEPAVDADSDAGDTTVVAAEPEEVNPADDADDTEDADDDADDAPAAPVKPVRVQKEGMLDGVPEEFIGPLLKSIVMHEVGHTLGLRHN